MTRLKLISWNVNGIRATLKKGFMDWFNAQQADIVFLQETKIQEEQVPAEVRELPGYHSYFSFAVEKKGYSGTAMFTKHKPINVTYGFGADPTFDNEGRIICAEFAEFVVYGIYFPNGQSADHRLAYKMAFYNAFLEHAEGWRKKGKGVIVCGDVNTAHKEIDLARPKENSKNSGFLPEERAWVDKLVAAGYYDTLRMFNQAGELYTFWDQRFKARDRNVGWRIDYFFVSEEVKAKVVSAFIQSEVMGSDHCPLGIELEVGKL